MSLPIRAVKIIKALTRFANDTAASIVEQRKATVADAHNIGQEQSDDMLSIMINSTRFSHGDLVNQTAHMVAAATETTSSTMGWAIHLLSRHPKVQERIRQEVRQSLPSPAPAAGTSALSEVDFQGMKYLDAVVKEVLRFHSVNTHLWREAVEPAQLVAPQYHRDPQYWGSDAREFNPDRWLEGTKGGANSAYAFLTFGGGPRRCPGDEYAKAQMRCLIAGLVGRFEFLAASSVEGSDDGVEVGDPMAFTLFKVMDGRLQVKVKEIEGW